MFLIVLIFFISLKNSHSNKHNMGFQMGFWNRCKLPKLPLFSIISMVSSNDWFVHLPFAPNHYTTNLYFTCDVGRGGIFSLSVSHWSNKLLLPWNTSNIMSTLICSWPLTPTSRGCVVKAHNRCLPLSFLLINQENKNWIRSRNDWITCV